MANPLKFLAEVSASSGLAVSGSNGLQVNQGGIKVNSGDITLASGLKLTGSSATVHVSQVTASFSGNGAGLTSLSASQLQNFASDVSAVIGGTAVTSVVGNDGISVSTVGGAATVSLSASVAGAGLAYSSGVLSVNVDDSTIEINSDSLRVKDGGITNTKLANSSITVNTGNGLTGGGAVSLGGTIALTASAASGGGLVVDSNGIGLSGSGAFTNNTVLKWNDAESKLVDSSITDDGAKVSLSTQLTGTSAYFTGDLKVLGTASIGLLNVIEQQSLNVGDKYIVLSSGSADHAGLEGAGLLWGSGAVGDTLFPDAKAHAAIVFRNAIDRLEIFPGISSSFVTASQLNVNGNVTLGDAVADAVLVNGTLSVKSSTNSGSFSIVTGDAWTSEGTVLNLTSALKKLDAASADRLTATEYYSVRASVVAQKKHASVGDIEIVFGSDLATNADLGQFTFGGITGTTSATSPTDLKNNKLRHLSFDVAVQQSVDGAWTNDLVAVELTSHESASVWYPKFVISAPALPVSGTVRLIVVNESGSALS
jgi:hypothetical protein